MHSRRFLASVLGCCLMAASCAGNSGERGSAATADHGGSATVAPIPLCDVLAKLAHYFSVVDSGKGDETTLSTDGLALVELASTLHDQQAAAGNAKIARQLMQMMTGLVVVTGAIRNHAGDQMIDPEALKMADAASRKVTAAQKRECLSG